MPDYEKYMTRCLQLAQLGEYYVAPNPMVGAVLVAADGTIISEGWHRRFGGPHAEVNCLNSESANRLIAESHTPTTLFVSLEPCSHFGKTPPCADLIVSKKDELRIERVVIGSLDPNPLVAGRGVKRLKEAGIDVITGVLEKECRHLNRRFLCLQEKHRPYIILKWAQTADGYIGSTDRRVVISNPLTKQIVHKMRAENMAIMVGTNTALTDNPKLLCTHWAGRNPVRILLDRQSRVPQNSNIFSEDAPTIVYRDNTQWQFILSDLADRAIHSVLVEGGATVLKHILETGIFDEVHIEVNPKISLHSGIKAPDCRHGFGSLFEDEEIDGNFLYTYHNY